MYRFLTVLVKLKNNVYHFKLKPLHFKKEQSSTYFMYYDFFT